MRKIIFTLLSLLIAAILAGCDQGASTATSNVTQESYDKLKAGMTLAEAKAILGEPAGTQEIPVRNTHIKLVIWEGSIKIAVSFDNQDILTEKRMAP